MIDDKHKAEVTTFAVIGCAFVAFVFSAPFILFFLSAVLSARRGGWLEFPSTLAEFGDSYGFANAIVSGLALVAIVVSLVYQRLDLSASLREMSTTSKATRQLAESQKLANTIGLFDLWHKFGEQLSFRRSAAEDGERNTVDSVLWHIEYFEHIHMRRLVSKQISEESEIGESEEEAKDNEHIESLEYWVQRILETWLRYEGRPSHVGKMAFVKDIYTIADSFEHFGFPQFEKPVRDFADRLRKGIRTEDLPPEKNLRSDLGNILLSSYRYLEIFAVRGELIESKDWMYE